MQIRAFTFFSKTYQEVEKAEKLLDNLNKEYNVWTKRISLPPTPKDLSLDKLVEIPSIRNNNDVIYSVASLTADDRRLSQIKDLLSISNRFYANVLVRDVKNLEEITKLILSLEPEDATRFGVLFGDWFLVSPYFPISTADVITNSFGLALLYTDEVMKGNTVRAISYADEIGRKLEAELKVKYLGVDVSLSPWMEKSVGEIIERRSEKIFNISNIWAMHELNQEILKASLISKVKPIGFSEVMLPVSEDNVLRRRAEDGSLTLTNLIALTYVCAAGIDMIAITRDKVTILNLMKALYSIRRVKMRPIGMRIVPTSGGKVRSKEFGDIPEVKVI